MGCGGGSALPPGAISPGGGGTVDLYEPVIERITPGSPVYDFVQEDYLGTPYDVYEVIHVSGTP